MRAPFEDEKLGVADAALQSICETRRRQLIVAAEGDLRRGGNPGELCFDVVSENRVRLLLHVPHVLEDLSGRVVDSYQLVSRLGAGGMGEVYLAHDTNLGRPVALKFLSPNLAADHDRLRRFHQEARAASSLNHPHIVVVHDFGELDGRPYMVTEFIEGETLRHRLQQGPLPVRDVVEIGVQMASALAAAHARGLVHRDVKPDNIMLRPDGYAKVLDFGLAKLANATRSSDPVDLEFRTQPGVVIGTPRYMSPEQACGLDLDARSDVWSLGQRLTSRIRDGLLAALGTGAVATPRFGPRTPKRTPSTSRASRSRAIPNQTAQRLRCSSGQARSMRNTRTRAARGGDVRKAFSLQHLIRRS